jgi:POT family proton-dependent oligopeptide transporter
MPLFGAYVSDTYLGRFKTIWMSVCVSIAGHIILTSSAAPSVLDDPKGGLAAVSK